MGSIDQPPLPSTEHDVDSIEAVSRELIQVTQAILNREWARAKGTAPITGASSGIGADGCHQLIVELGDVASGRADGEAVAILDPRQRCGGHGQIIVT
ncbi:MAG: hypothetical protein WA624_19870 [Methylocella sp.]